MRGMQPARSLAITVALVAIAGAARASEHPNAQSRSAWDRTIVPKVHFGSEHAAFGAFAGSLELAPNRYVALDVGGGKGRGAPTGAALLRGRVGDDSMRVGLGGGVSTGPALDAKNDCSLVSGAFVFPAGGCSADYEYGSRRIDRAWFAVFELTMEMRARSGFHGGFALGWSHLVNRTSDWRCLDRCEGVPLRSRGRFYFDLVFGWAFG